MLQPHKGQNYSIVERISIASAYIVTFFFMSLIIIPQNIPFLGNNVSSESTAVTD